MPAHSFAILMATTRVTTLAMNTAFMFAMAAGVVLSGCASIPEPVSDPALVSVMADARIEREDRQSEVAADLRCIVVANQFGDIHLRAGIAERIAYHAVIQRIDIDLPRPEIETLTQNNCALLQVRIEGQHSDSQQPWNVRRARVDIAIAVPPGVVVDARSDVGSIDAKKLDNTIHARTLDGDIQLSGSGDVFAQSVSGAIALTARGERPDRRWQATTVTGVIHAFVEAQVASLTASTCGVIRNQFVSAVIGESANGCHASYLGQSDAPNVVLRSEHGDIEVFRLEP